MKSLVRFEIKDAVAKLTLTRADKRNALQRETLEQLSAALGQVRSSAEARVLVLAAEGAVFCAGMDLGEMQKRAESPDGAADWQRDSEVYCDVLQQIYSLPMPTVAAMTGPALAGGVGLVLACDLVVATTNAFFALPEPMRGITAAMVTPLLIHRVGAGPATALLLSGERWTAERALQLGLCHDVVKPDDFTQRLDSLVASILSGSQQALAITKQHVVHVTNRPVEEMLTYSIQVSALARETLDAREGLQAFLEKRKPRWQPEGT